MKESAQYLDLAARIAAAVAGGAPFDDILSALRSAIRGVIPCDRIALAFLHSDGTTLVLGPVLSSGKIRLGTGYRESIAQSSLRALMQKNRIRIINDLPAHLKKRPGSHATKLLIEEGMRSSLTVPLMAGGEPAGVLWFSSRKPGAYLTEHEPVMRLIAQHVSHAIEKARLAGSLSATREIRSRLRDENSQLREALTRAPELIELVGESPPWRKTLRKIEVVAGSDATVLLRGETGTGKELIARAIHRLSRRKDRPFVAINCGALSRELIASELFGHERGAFTGALQRKLGRLDLAQGGTLFLDEVAELSGDLQVKLLRVLQEREYERVGGTQTIRADVRVIAATHRNLETERTEGRFRDDLFFRLNVFPILVPPLRERKEDLAPLLDLFLRKYSQKIGKTFERVDPRTFEQCLLYHWPGNVRELENLVERSVILSSGADFFMDPLLDAEARVEPAGAATRLDEVIRNHLVKILRSTRGKLYGNDGAAAILGVKPSTLQAKLKKLGIDHRNC
jgi:formate hydrogenlyase transcriptional activator